jgi:hypothetical protein
MPENVLWLLFTTELEGQAIQKKIRRKEGQAQRERIYMADCGWHDKCSLYGTANLVICTRGLIL